MAATYFSNWEREACKRECVFVRGSAHLRHSLLGHLHVGFLAPVRVHTLVPSVDVHTGLCFSTLVLPCFTFVNICGRGMTRSDRNRTKIGLCGGRLKSDFWRQKELMQKLWWDAYPGIAWCLAAGIPPDTRKRTSRVHLHTGTGTGNWSSCTHQCLSSHIFRLVCS